MIRRWLALTYYLPCGSPPCLIFILIHYTVETRQPGNRKAACTPKTKCRLLFHLIRMLFGSKSALFGCCKNRCNTAASAGFSRPVYHSPMK